MIDDALTDIFGDLCRADVSLGAMTTYRVGGAARWFATPTDRTQLDRVARLRAETGLAVLVVGRGSNMLVADAGFDGLVLSMNKLATDVEIPEQCDDGASVVVAAGGGVALPRLARMTAAAGLRGFEWAVGVPGSIGGAVRMNAGGHGSEMKHHLIDVDVFDLDDPERAVHTLGVNDLGLRFRASDLTPGVIVLSARLALTGGDTALAQAQIDEIVNWRRTHQPGGQNCGSVFVNPVPNEVFSGALIDGLGLKGFTIGTAHVSDKHANFIQASPGGSGDDVKAVIDAVRERVLSETGYHLRAEVRMVGFTEVDPFSFAEPDESTRCD